MMDRYSASAIQAFKACPIRYRNAYVYLVRKIQESDSQHQGNVWHKLQEIVGLKPGSKCIHCEGENCVFCGGTGILPNDLSKVIVDYINREYAVVPEYKTQEDWLIERTILINAIFGCLNYYKGKGLAYEVMVPELQFKLPFVIGGKEHQIVGKIDQIVKDEFGNYYVREFKSTSKSLDDESYWSHLNLDTQITIYLVAAQIIQVNGGLEQYGIKKTDPLISRVLYNVFHKPQIRPKNLTQGDTKKFTKDGEYFGQKFVVKTMNDNSIYVGGETALITPGAKEGAFAIYETTEMFGTRLTDDITKRPEFYFQQRELSRTTQDLQSFVSELTNIIEISSFMEKHNMWFSNEQQCYAKFKCDYIDVCSNHIPIDGNNIPNGFECIKKENKNVTTANQNSTT